MARKEQIEELRRLVENQPNEPRWLLKLGDLLQQERRLDEAIDCYHRAADLYTRAREDMKTVAILSTILKLDPARTATRVHLGRAYLALDMRDEAIEEFTRAAKEYAKRSDEIGERLARAEIDRLTRPS